MVVNKQQKEVQQVFLDNEKEVLKLLKKNYQDALSEINAKIDVLIARQDSDMQYVIYQVEYQKALRTQVQSILEQLQANEFNSISEYLTNSYNDGFIGTMYDMQGQGVPLILPIDQKQVVAAIQHETKLSENLYSSLGKNIKVLNKQISGEISRGISSGMTTSEIARNISGYAGISQNRAMTIARTEGHRIQCKATLDAQYKAKEKGADVLKQWDSFLDGNTRDSHRKLDGQIRELDEPFEVDGLKAMHPGGFGRPEHDINCRCAILQRARWALEADIPVTKWSEDAPVVIDDDGVTQYIDMSDAKNYKEFKERYNKVVEKTDESSKISLKEHKAILEYMSATSYIVNEKLRIGTILTETEKEFADNLNSALDKMPTYEGNLQRSLLFYSDEDVEEFIKDYKVGSTISYNEFLSTTKGETYNPEGQVQIFIQDAKKGKDISYFNSAEQEVLYKDGSEFDVLNIVQQDEKYYILLGEKNE